MALALPLLLLGTCIHGNCDPGPYRQPLAAQTRHLNNGAGSGKNASVSAGCTDNDRAEDVQEDQEAGATRTPKDFASSNISVTITRTTSENVYAEAYLCCRSDVFVVLGIQTDSRHRAG